VKRRELVTLLGGAAAWPLAARAQQPAMQVIGLLGPVLLNEELLRGFRQGLKQAGFVEGENVSILYHFAENEIDRLPALADDLARRPASSASRCRRHCSASPTRLSNNDILC
jgi:putative tryptophan/tyrosine transport system substrate-binding protein